MAKKVLIAVMALMLMLTLSVGTAADNYTPSVTQKGAPDVVPVTDGYGNSYAATICDGNQDTVVQVPAEQLSVTPYSAAENASEDVRTKLKNAYQQILNAKDLSELVPEIGQTVADLKNEIKVENLVVRDLFDVSLDDAYKSHLDTIGNTITVRFAVNIAPEETLIVLHNYQDSLWEIIDGEAVVRHENGDVSITFDSLSPVAFAVKGDDDGPVIGTKYFVIGIAIVMFAVGLVGIFYVAIAMRRKHAQAVEEPTVPIDREKHIQQGKIGALIGMGVVGVSFAAHLLQEKLKGKKSDKN